jgi:hypothetical protein
MKGVDNIKTYCMDFITNFSLFPGFIQIKSQKLGIEPRFFVLELERSSFKPLLNKYIGLGVINCWDWVIWNFKAR